MPRKEGEKHSVNDRMVKWTALPAIFLWLAASGSVVAMGIIKPDVVLTNLEGFIALIAIIGGTAAPAFATILELWKAEQTIETELHPEILQSKAKVIEEQAALDREMARLDQQHRHELEKKQQEFEHTISHGKKERES